MRRSVGRAALGALLLIPLLAATVFTGTASAAAGLTAQASGSVPLGGRITDTATLDGGVLPVGTITFDLFGPNNRTCAGAPVFTSAAAVTGNGRYASAGFTPTVAGTYRWVVRYSGGVTNRPVATACSDARQHVQVTPAAIEVTQAATSVTTVASPDVMTGETVNDTATLHGGDQPTGSIRFSLYGPDDPTCTEPVAFISVKPLPANPNDPVTSGDYVTSAPGLYRWIASYTGDANNDPSTGACNDPNESVMVGVRAVVSGQASPSVAVGGTISDTATLSRQPGLDAPAAPTGTMTFNLYGPGNTTCTGTPLQTSTASVTGFTSYMSAAYTATAAGTYRYVAVYSGDFYHTPAATACTDPNQRVEVTAASPQIDTLASESVTLGGAVNDRASLTQGFNPTGTITFNLYGPDDATCTGPAAFTSTATVSGNGDYLSGNYTPSAAGTYRWIAGYSGDANNLAVTGACNDVNENVDVTAPPTVTITTQASPSVQLGGTISDTATLSGPFSPTGTVTFFLYGPDDATCNTEPIFSSTSSITDGQASSGPYTPVAPGTYRWIAVYSGGPGTTPVSGACNDPNENVDVTFPEPEPGISLTKSANPTSRPAPGGDFTFTAVVTNTGFVPLELNSLVDDIYGDLDGQGTCSLPAYLPFNGSTYSCSFTGSFTGVAGDSQTDTITAMAGEVIPTVVAAAPGDATATASATVRITAAGSPSPDPSPTPTSTPTPTPGPSSTPAPSPSVLPTTIERPDPGAGGLPVTGSELGRLAFLGATLVAAGGLALVAARRRRRGTTQS